ncbi:hypothetical protein AS033_06055 [Exiguobacterium indicum]|uniref:Aminoglycoside nucleotidyltransferase n=1 Tax=Exiguobacterium indicum TaxID=296995 RepID=A0A0V8GKY0_9BACL|nr:MULTISPECIES: hypothetical protein [Exiguobacterium]KSU50942.1 hypothetical protein AS033_06055 [Exiguobacterium enclense]KTR27811.1 hypothetical protein RSA11_03865 [Exiguobacterium indicum]SDC16898.1 hypothetical protein SAMN05216342_1238 [Exiguobacterium enclense]
MSLEQVLEKVVACLQQEQIQFGIGGSLLLHHHGLPVTPRDIDLVVALADAERAVLLLSEMGTVLEQDETSLYATEVFQEFIIEGIDIDLMSGLQVRHDEGVFIYPFAEQSIDSVGPPFMALVDWYVIYQLIPGREQKVTMIEDVFTKQEVDRERLEQLRSLVLPQVVRNRIDQWLN